MTTSYIINSVLWSAVGGIGGYYFGRMRRDVSELRKRVAMDQSDAPGAVAQGQRTHHRPTMQQILGVVVVVLALISIATVRYQNAQLAHAQQCYVQFVHDTAGALQARDADSQRAREANIGYLTAMSSLVQGFLTSANPNSAPTAEQRQEAVASLATFFKANQSYSAALQALNRSAQTYPIPDAHC